MLRKALLPPALAALVVASAAQAQMVGPSPAGGPRAVRDFIGLASASDAFEIQEGRLAARRASDPDEPDGYRVPHTAIAYLLDAEGRCLSHFADALAAEEVLDRMRLLLATQPRQSGA